MLCSSKIQRKNPRFLRQVRTRLKHKHKHEHEHEHEHEHKIIVQAYKPRGEQKPKQRKILVVFFSYWFYAYAYFCVRQKETNDFASGLYRVSQKKVYLLKWSLCWKWMPYYYAEPMSALLQHSNKAFKFKFKQRLHFKRYTFFWDTLYIEFINEFFSLF